MFHHHHHHFNLSKFIVGMFLLPIYLLYWLIRFEWKILNIIYKVCFNFPYKCILRVLDALPYFYHNTNRIIAFSILTLFYVLIYVFVPKPPKEQHDNVTTSVSEPSSNSPIPSVITTASVKTINVVTKTSASLSTKTSNTKLSIKTGVLTIKSTIPSTSVKTLPKPPAK